MDIKFIYKPNKNDVVLYALNRKEEYQGEMPWESIQILRTMFIKESVIKRKIQETNVESCLA